MLGAQKKHQKLASLVRKTGHSGGVIAQQTLAMIPSFNPLEV
jgi:hypothetical protein